MVRDSETMTERVCRRLAAVLAADMVGYSRLVQVRDQIFVTGTTATTSEGTRSMLRGRGRTRCTGLQVLPR